MRTERIEPRLLSHPGHPASSGMGHLLHVGPRGPASAPARPQGAASPQDGNHRLLHVFAYLAAVVIGLSLAPAVILLASRTEFLHWANAVLNLVSRH
jgi:hypothetical protein